MGFLLNLGFEDLGFVYLGLRIHRGLGYLIFWRVSLIFCAKGFMYSSSSGV